MKQFKPFDKIIHRLQKDFVWEAGFYDYYKNNEHHIIGGYFRDDDNILPYEGNEHLVGTTDEPEEEIVLKEGEFMICSMFDFLLKKGKGTVCNYSHITDSSIRNTDGGVFLFCIPMSKYNSNNLEETSKWILTVKNGKLVKVNK